MELLIYRGRTNKINIWVTQGGGIGSDQEAYDLTGCALWLTAKSQITDADPAAVFQLSTGAGSISITSAINGQAQAVISPADTDSMPYARKKIDFDLQLKTSDGEYWTIAKGVFVVDPNITRRTA